jgi:hypothetical protein
MAGTSFPEMIEVDKRRQGGGAGEATMPSSPSSFVKRGATSNHEQRRHGVPYRQITAAPLRLKRLCEQLLSAHGQGLRRSILTLLIASAVAACSNITTVPTDPSCARVPGGGDVVNTPLESPAQLAECPPMDPLTW